jgi:hypothetical protein
MKVAALAWLAVAACSKDAQITLRTVTMHVPAACAAGNRTYAEFYALGDFEPAPLMRGHLLSRLGEELPEIDHACRELVAHATDSGRDWNGVASVPQAGDVDVLLLPSLTSCELSTSVDPRIGTRLAPMDQGRVLVVGGSGATDNLPTPHTFVADMRTGEVVPVGTGLLTQRTRASVTAFGDGAIVAGGVTPREGMVLANAEVYAPSVGGFDQQRPIQIGGARADQGAIVLVTGETLLVGGVGGDLKTPLSSMETIDPISRTVRTEGIAQLAVARRAPVVIRLASGEILVAGGFDANDTPIATLEWFAPDASRPTKRARDLVTSTARAFAPLGAGGAIAVVSPPPNAPPDFQNVWVIDADGGIEAATGIQGPLTRPVLFGGAGAAPVLWTGDRWLRWQPWGRSFGALDLLDHSPAQIGDATCAPDAGLALWIAADSPMLTAMRFDVRNEYAPLSHALLVDDTSETAPDRLPTAGTLAFDASLGLVLAPGASAFVTDRTYADAAIDVDAPTGEPALVVLRDELGSELEVGDPSCPGALVYGSASVHITRRGGTVSWRLPGGANGVCKGTLRSNARVSVGLRAPSSAARSVVRNLRVVRLRRS